MINKIYLISDDRFNTPVKYAKIIRKEIYRKIDFGDVFEMKLKLWDTNLNKYKKERVFIEIVGLTDNNGSKRTTIRVVKGDER